MQRLILNLDLITSKCCWFLMFGFFALLLNGNRLNAQTEYKFNSNIQIDPDLEKKIRVRYPAVRNRQDLIKVLKFISRSNRYQYVNAKLVGDTFFFEVEKAKFIGQISIETYSFGVKKLLLGIISEFTGKVDSTYVLSVMKQKIRAILSKRGYTLSRVQVLQTNNDTSSTSYKVVIAENPPCILEAVSEDFSLPSGISIDIEKGDICDIEEISQKVRMVQDELRKEKYADSIIDVDRMEFNPRANTSRLFLKGSVGRRRVVQVETEKRKFFLDDYFKDSELDELAEIDIDADTLAVEIVEAYGANGFLDAQIDKRTLVKIDQFNETLYFKVTKGVQYKVERVFISGNKFFDSDLLASVYGFDGLYPSGQITRKADFSQGVERVKLKYQEKGFLEVEVAEPIYKKNTAQSVDVYLEITENSRYHISSVRFEGARSLKKEYLLDAIGVDVDEPINMSEISGWEQVLTDIYKRIGYLFVKIKIDFEAIKTVKGVSYKNLIFKINEGPRVKIGQIVVKGLIKTKHKVVVRELLFKTGDWYLRDLIDRTQRNLSELGIFSSINIRLLDQGNSAIQPGVVDLAIEIRESMPGSVSFGPGWSIIEGLRFRVDASYLNLGGSGRRLFGKFKLSEERQQEAIGNESLLGRNATLGYIEPWIVGLPIDGLFTIQHSAEANNFWTLSNSGELALEHRVRMILKDSSIAVFFGQELTEEVGTARQDDSLITSGNIRVGRVGLRVRVDERNDRRWPTAGFYSDAEVAWARYALGGDVAYFNWNFNVRVYYELFENFVFATSLSYGSFDNVNREKSSDPQVLPSAERLYAGGGETVRGFVERTLGPSVLDVESGDFFGDELGGSRRLIWKNELRYLFLDPFAISFFADFGNVWFSQEEEAEIEKFISDPKPSKNIVNNVDYSLEEFLLNPFSARNKLYYSYGIALGALTPLGSLNVSFGIPQAEPKSDYCRSAGNFCRSTVHTDQNLFKRGAFSFNFGVTF